LNEILNCNNLNLRKSLKKMKTMILYFTLLFCLSGCSLPDYISAYRTSNTTIDFLKSNEWGSLYEITSIDYRNKIGISRFSSLERWVNKELGAYISKKQHFFYSESFFLPFRPQKITSVYLCEFENADGEISIELVKENEVYKITNINFTKIAKY